MLKIRTTDVETLQRACQSLAKRLAECHFEEGWVSDNSAKVILAQEGIEVTNDVKGEFKCPPRQ